jgi:hypothetical protein|tara:strand:+ start:158 stop:412 length:255 start_codon:yes stop_codon:yes gene_type:complete
MSHPISTMVYEQEGYALRKDNAELVLDATGKKFIDPFKDVTEIPLIFETVEEVKEYALDNMDVAAYASVIKVTSDSYGDVEYFF